MPDSNGRVVKTKRWIAIGGIVSTGIVTIATPLLILYVEYAPKIQEAQYGAETSYEVIAPAVAEIQDILEQSQTWSEYVDQFIETHDSSIRDMEKRLARCEAYIEVLSERRRLPPPPPVEESSSYSTESAGDYDRAPPVQRTTRYSIPKDLDKAKKQVEKRKKMKCGPLDPLCGSE